MTINTRLLLPFFFFAYFATIAKFAQAQDKAYAIPKILSAGDSLLIKELYLQGIQQKASGQVATAEKTFEKLIVLQPDNDAAHFELARIYLEREDYSSAAQAATQAARHDPDNEWYWTMLLDIYKNTGNVEEMPAVFDELIRLNPEKESNYYDKAYALYLGQEYADALATYAEIAAKFGETDEQYLAKHQIHIAQGDTQAAIEELETLVSRNPKDSNGYVLLAELYTRTRHTKRALALLDEASEIFPTDPVLFLAKSDTYLAMGKQKQAYGYLQQAFRSNELDIDTKAGLLYSALAGQEHAISVNSLTSLADLLVATYPKDVKAHAVRGDVYTQLQQPEQARQAYLDALNINRYIDGIWQQLLQVELQLGRFDDVETHGKEALQLFPNHAILLFFTGHGFLGNKNYSEARNYLEAALNNAHEEHTPLLTQLYSNLGDVYNTLGMHAESDVAYEEAISQDSANAYALNNYAYYLSLRKENLSRAAEMAKKANELEPNNASYEDTYAWVLFQQGSYEEALVWIERALKNSGNASDTLLEHYGDVLAKLGKINTAVTQWKKAKAISQSTGKDIDILVKKINERRYIE